ncbi:MAG: hypothetical protein KAS17_06765 [Victivallaceae bacterium]|nr:hypothetical protein [Victivallaceae bacterium]
MKSTYVNWGDTDIYRNWDFIGAGIMYDKELEKLSHCSHGNKEKEYCHTCECYPDDTHQDNKPVVNYAYPLFSEPDEEKIIKVCEETGCTVVYNSQDDNYYLALTGCGMNLSQDIALAYIIVDGCIEWGFLENVSVSGAFSVSKEDYQIILNELERQLAISIDNQTRKLKEVTEQLKNDLPLAKGA